MSLGRGVERSRLAGRPDLRPVWAVLGEARETACLDRAAPQHQPRALGETPPRLADLLRACRGAFKSQDLELQTHLPTVEPVPGSSSFGISPLHFTMKTCQGPRPPLPRRVSLRVTPSLQVSTFQLEFPSGIITTFGICDSNSYFESSLGQLACG